MTGRVQWILDVDISKFFDTLDKSHLRLCLQHRVRDGVITRLIGKWLKAGVLEQGVLYHPETGTPQGGSCSPLLSNVYLHYVLDLWFAQEVIPRLRGRAFMCRFADDVVMGFERLEDVEKVLHVLPKRLGKYGLRVHPDKTRLVAFGRPNPTKGNKPGTFDYLGFTHYWTRGRKGTWVVKRKTAAQRLRRAGKRVWQWCQKHRHDPMREQCKTLSSKLRGHYQYYGITGNGLWLKKFEQGVRRIWQKWLHRRSRSSTDMPWNRFRRLMERYRFPPPRVVHSVYAAKP